jgi:Porin PorA
MRMSRSSLILCLIAVLLLAAAAVVRFAVLPSVSKLPTDLHTTQDYAGTYSGLNPEALSGDTSLTAAGTVALTASRQYVASSTHGNTQVVTRILNRSVIGKAAPESRVKYAVDRGTFASTTAPSGSTGVVPSQGLIFSLPLHPSTTASYRLWDEATAASYPLTYQGTATIEERSTYRYASTATGPVTAPATLGLATSFTRDQLTDLGPSLASLLPEQLRSAFPTVLAALPSTVPVTWTSAMTSTIWADTTTGAPIRVHSTQKISGGISVLGQTLSIPLATLALATTRASEQAIADDAASNASTLTLVGTVLPLVLLGLALLLLALSVVLAVRAGRHPGGTAPAAPEPERTPTPV